MQGEYCIYLRCVLLLSTRPQPHSSSSTCLATLIYLLPRILTIHSHQHSISTHSTPPKDHSHPAAVVHLGLVPAVPTVHNRPAPQDTNPVRSDCDPAAAAAPEAAEAVRNPAARSGPTAAVVVAAAVVVGPTAGAVGLGLGVERRKFADVLVAKRGCTGVGLGCRIDLSDVGVEVDRIVGRIRGEGVEVGRSCLVCRCRTVAVT